MPSEALAKEGFFLRCILVHFLGVWSMKYVYLLESISAPERRYVGITGDLEQRLFPNVGWPAGAGSGRA